jgi:hypothetical protein
VSDKHAQMREMARDLIRNSVIEDAIAQRIAQIVEFIHEDRIKPLQQRAYTRADMEAAIQRALEGAANAAYHWWDAPDAEDLRHHIRYNLDPAQFIEEPKV